MNLAHEDVCIPLFFRIRVLFIQVVLFGKVLCPHQVFDFNVTIFYNCLVTEDDIVACPIMIQGTKIGQHYIST